MKHPKIRIRTDKNNSTIKTECEATSRAASQVTQEDIGDQEGEGSKNKTKKSRQEKIQTWQQQKQQMKQISITEAFGKTTSSNQGAREVG